MKILVTGANGLIGYAIREIAVRYPQHEFFFSSREDTNLIKPDEVARLYERVNPDWVVHAAGQVGGIGGNMDYQEDYFYNNILMNSNVIRYACLSGVKKLIAFSSTCVFSREQETFVEDDMQKGEPFHIHFAYAYAKRMVDIHIKAAKRQYGVDYCSAIPGNIFGKYDNFNLEEGHVTPSLIYKCQLAKRDNVPFKIWGSGNAKRELIYSLDIAEILIRILELEQPLPNRLLVGSDDELSIKELVEKIADLSEFDGEIVFDKNKPDGQLRKKSNISRLKTLLPDFKFTNLDVSLKETIEWFTQNYPNIRGIK